MEFGDFLWAIIWFFIGVIIFELPYLKGFMDSVGLIVSIVSVGIFVVTKPDLLIGYILNIPFSYIGSTTVHYVYLIGANFGRASHFNTEINWGRIFLYIVIIVGLMILLIWLNKEFATLPVT